MPKYSLAQQCRLENDGIISCIIRGLPIELQANARAFQCTTPDELYAGFIAPMDNYQTPMSSHVKVPRLPVELPKYKQKPDLAPYNSIRCYNCGKSGHISRDCRKQSSRCFTCNRRGHISSECRFRQDNSSQKEPAKNVKTVLNCTKISDVYKKIYQIDGVDIIGFIDTGSEINVITPEITSRLNLPIIKENNILKGFGGRYVYCETVANFSVTVDELVIDTSAVISEISLNGIDFLIGP